MSAAIDSTSFLFTTIVAWPATPTVTTIWGISQFRFYYEDNSVLLDHYLGLETLTTILVKQNYYTAWLQSYPKKLPFPHLIP